MKIKLAFLDSDAKYLKRITAVFSTKYAEQLEVYSFTDPEVALPVVDNSRIDVLVAGEEFGITPEALPERCSLACLVETPDIAEINGQATVGKYQRPDLIYRQVLSLYSDKASAILGHAVGEGTTQIISFSSPAGGVGTSTLAAACAVNLTMRGKNCLYLNLELFGPNDLFFTGEGQFDLSDVIFALKSKRGNLSIKLESCVKRSSQGVFFYAQPKVALDLLELNEEETLALLDELRKMGSYDFIILDTDFGLSRQARNLYRQAQKVVWVSDGSELANGKLRRAYQSIEILEEREDAPLPERLCVAYNRFSSKTGRQLESFPLKMLGGARRLENRTVEQVVSELTKSDMFEQLLQE